MRLIGKNTIYDPSQWGAYEKWFAVSQDGEFIAVRIMDAGNVWEDERNVFVYDTNGRLLWAMGNCFSHERGIAFWPDKYHILIPGCDPGMNASGRDGLKNHKIGSTDYTLPFQDTPVTGIGCELIGVSDSSQYVLSTGKQEIYCIDTLINQVTPLPDVVHRLSPYYQATFSVDEKYVALTHQVVDHDFILELSSGKSVWNSRLPYSGQRFLCFSPDNKHFLCSSSSHESGLSIWSLEILAEVSTTFCSENILLGKYAKSNGRPFVFTPYAAIYSNHGDFLITFHRNGKIFIRDSSGIVGSTEVSSGSGQNYRLKLKMSVDDGELIAVNGESIVIWKIEI